MIDLSGPQTGEINASFGFSDLYASAVISRFTGGILVACPKSAAVFFRTGIPVVAAGPGFEADFLGEILIFSGACSESLVSQALARQTWASTPRSLMGALLVSNGVDAGSVRDAIRIQTQRRMHKLFAVVEGSWTSAPGENELMADISSDRDLLLHAQHDVSDEELFALSTELLGKALQMSDDLREPGFQLGRIEKKILRYIKKPRHLHQIENACGDRRTARTLVRMLFLSGGIQMFPSARAVPLPKRARSAEEAEVSLPPGDEQVMDRAASRPHRRAVEAIDIDLDDSDQAAAADWSSDQVQHHAEFDFDDEDSSPYSPATGGHDELVIEFSDGSKAQPADVYGLKLEVEDVLGETPGDYDHAEGEANRSSSEPAVEAELKHEVGLVLLHGNKFQEARDCFEIAMRNDPDNAQYMASYAWSMIQDPEFDHELALEKGHALLLEALQRDQLSPTIHYYLGRVLKEKLETGQALVHFQRALDLDPEHAGALQELGRSPGGEESVAQPEEGSVSSVLSRLFELRE